MQRILFLLCIAGTLAACSSQKKDPVKKHAFTNDLIHETSPYLLQHAHNPVDWKAWNPTTLAKAKEENKLMIVSVGYAACHWCHVMERESFEDSTVASVMNTNFIPVKVDREERPDVDQVYINAVQLMTGRAGWPLNVITLPDGRPVWGGTYFQKEDWIQAIEQIQTLYRDEPQKLIDYATRLEEGIKSMDLVTLNTDEITFKDYDTQSIIANWSQSFDKRHGGFGGAPKFMMPNNVAYLLREATATKDEALMSHVTLTLDQMAYGGVYDQVGGGFARYSTDAKWHVPHFEKMLYDNAQLVSLYSHAFAVTKKPLYKEVVEETLAYIAREMTTDEGAFYSSLDADSETADGELEEGAYYIYTEEELQNQIGEDFPLFKEYYNVNEFGKWEEEEKYVLIRDLSDTAFTEKFSISSEILKGKKEQWKKTLMSFRNKRPLPRLDDKTLTSWNGLMLKGYVDAYKIFGTQTYLEAAIKNATFIQDHQIKADDGLYHNYKDGKSSINGYLEDYAAVIEGYISLYEVTLDQKWMQLAKKLTDYAFEHFSNKESGMFYFTSNNDTEIVTRTTEYRDNVIPASNSIMAKNLAILSHHFDDQNYAKTAHQMLKNVQPEIEKYPAGFSNWLDLLANYQSNYYEIVVVGSDAPQKAKEINQHYLPGKLIAGTTTENKAPLFEQRFVEGLTFIYVCVNNACKLPVEDTAQALKLLD